MQGMKGVLMSKIVKRGYVPTDARDFGEKQLPNLKASAEEVYYLLNRGYSVKNASTFVGNHHLLSERQRLAIARAVSPEKQIQIRKEKQLSDSDLKGRIIHIDGFNTIITLEIAFSESLLLDCMDGTVRDLAGLRGTYRLVDKTDTALNAIYETLSELQIEKAVFYLDAPVSNSGRLAQRIHELFEHAPFVVETKIENAVDFLLKQQQDCIISADAIILDECQCWYNLTRRIIDSHFEQYPYVKLL